MEEHQREHLRNLAKDAIARQPRMALLQDRLLGLGGAETCFFYMPWSLDKLLERGEVFSPPIIRVKGKRSQCHDNACRLWRRAPKRYRIVNGYGLSDDGIWREHSWCLNKQGKVVETTEPRLIYFGFVLTEDESNIFCSC